MKKATKLVVAFFLSILFLGLGTYIYWQTTLPLVSPIALIENIYQPEKKGQRVVYGFLPYWNLKHKDNLQINYLTHLAYFALDLNEDGTANKKVNRQELEPGWNKLNSEETKNIFLQSKLLKQKTVLTVTAMDPELIESIVNNPNHSQTAINSILETYRDLNFDGINVDFEYVGEPDNITINNFTLFVKNLKESCQITYPNCFIDIDVFGDAASKKRLWDLEAIHPHVSHIIVMAYDYYRKSSTQAGPVAPLTGACKGIANKTCLEQDILEHLSLYTKKVPQNKIILGVPFYGYEWQTASEDFLANTYPKTGGLATYQRVKELLADPEISSLSAKWSNLTLSPYIIYYDEEKIKQIHYENEFSLKLKVDVLKATDLGGIAIWALGYETPYNEIWSAIAPLNN